MWTDKREMAATTLLMLTLVWGSACGISKTVDEVIRDAARMGRATLNPDEVLIDMDMRYKKEDWEQMMSNVTAQKGIKGDYFRWTNKRVPYTIDTRAFNSESRALIRKAMDEWEKYTCLTFTPRSTEQNYVHVQNDNSGCNSYVGMRHWGSQPLNLGRGCLWHHTIVHEFGHAIGMQHEHQRPERDSYISIRWNAVGDGWSSAFTKMNPANIDNAGVQYDYLSVMHYGQHAFSHNNRDVTIVTHDSDYQSLIGRSPGLAFSDIMLANRLYSCDDGCNNVDCGPEGFVGEDCKCYCDNHSWSTRLCECGTEGCGDGGDNGGGGDGIFPCKDDEERCEMWASTGECEINPMYMLYWCPKACAICGDNAGCKDYNSECGRWKTEGYCANKEYEDYMHRHCRKACSYC